MLQTVYRYLFRRSFFLVPYPYRDDFLKEITLNNHVRIRPLLVLLLLYGVLMFISDFLLIKNMSPGIESRYIILDSLLIVAMFVFFIMNWWLQPKKKEDITMIHTYQIWAFSAFMLFWTSVVAGLEFQYSTSFTSYLIAVFLIAGLFYIRGTILAFLLLSSTLVLLGIMLSRDVDIVNTFPGFFGLFVLVPIAFTISRYLFISRMQQFVQKIEMQMLNHELEERVKERTTELEEKNKNLKNEIFIRKSYEKTLKEARKKAEEADQLKTAFLANMSHEIRTPMNGIVGFSQLLRRPSLSEEKRNTYLDIIHSNSLQLQSIINDIIDLSKIEANQISIENEYFDVNKLITDQVSFFNEYINIENKKDVKIEIARLLEEKNKIIYADKTKLTQVLNNLVKNAIKFTERGSVKLKVYLQEGTVILEVSDTGIGIKKEDLFIIFERFRQVDDSARRIYGGAGLGLSITKGLVSKMNGKISVDSQPGEGSTFTVILPHERSRVDSISVGEIPKLDWRKYTFLLVEDDITSRFFLEEILHPTGVKIISCDNGIKAVEICREEKDIDLVLMDIQLPGMDGYATTREIKKLKPDLKIIAQTANAFSEDQSKCMEAGCCAYLSKPIEPSKLFNTLVIHLNEEK